MGSVDKMSKKKPTQLKKRKTCNSCKALNSVGIGYECLLSYPIKTTYVKTLLMSVDPVPLEKCPKPLTIIDYSGCKEYLKFKGNK